MKYTPALEEAIKQVVPDLSNCSAEQREIWKSELHALQASITSGRLHLPHSTASTHPHASTSTPTSITSTATHHTASSSGAPAATTCTTVSTDSASFPVSAHLPVPPRTSSSVEPAESVEPAPAEHAGHVGHTGNTGHLQGHATPPVVIVSLHSLSALAAGTGAGAGTGAAAHLILDNPARMIRDAALAKAQRLLDELARFD